MALQCYHREGWLGADFRYMQRVTSTNDLVLDAGQQGAPEGLVIVAEEQTAGRGRLARRWNAPPGTCLLMSLLFRPPEPFAYYAGRIPMLCGLALVEAVRHVAGLSVALKWPNDLIIAHSDDTWHKVAGMLSEIGMQNNVPAFVVIGIGLNVNVPRALLPDLAPDAASLSVEIGHALDRVALLDGFLGRAESLYARLRDGYDPLPQWRKNLAWRGHAVQVQTPTQSVTGIMETVDEEGALVLRFEDGAQQCFSVGDLSLRI